MSKGTTVTMFSRSNDTLSSNVGAKEAWGHKKRENLFINSFVGTSSGGVSYVNSKTRSTNDIQGKIINTGVVSDIAIDGSGLLVVSESPTGTAKFTRRGDFRQDELGFWKNGADQLLKAWKLDNKGELPQNTSLLESLESVNFANTKGAPVATTVVSIAMNLNADQEALRGNGVDAVLNRTGKNTGKKIDNILFPEKLGGSSLSLGDEFVLHSDAKADKVLTFGGMVLARRPDVATGNTIFGATGAGVAFTFAPVPGPGLLSVGHKLRITVAGQAYTFSAVQGAESAANRTFNTINGLAAAINRISSLKAEVDLEGRLYIAPTKANDGIVFANDGGGTIVEALGLVNLAPAPLGTTRFNSLASLRDAVNKDQATDSLKATIEGKDLKITSLLSTSVFNIKANSLGLNAISSATQQTGEIGRASVFISAPGHNLQAGDFVKITGTGQAQLPDGLYYISGINPNGFTINRKDANPALFPAAILAPAAVPINAGATWQKVPGQQFQTFNNPTLDTAGVGGVVTITLPGGTAATGVFPAEAWANGNVIYISGVGAKLTVNGENIIVPDGYYEIANYNNAAGGGASTFDITPTASVAPGPVLPVAGPFSIKKIATGGVAAMDTRSFVTVGGNAAPGSSVRMYMPNHGYAVGDLISFTNLAGPTVIDGLTINNGISYKITAVNSALLGGNASPSIEFKVLDPLGNPMAATTGDGNTNPVNLVAGLAANFAVNNGSQFMKYFSIDQAKTTYDKTYDAANVDKNLSASANGIANFASSLTYSVPLTVYDSLGSSYTLLLYFAKLDSNTWAVELTAQKDKDGVFQVTNLATGNGLIRQGIIKFDTDGRLQGIPEGFEDAIPVQRNNGSTASNITIDWENTLSDITSGNVSQTKAPNNVEIIQGDGQGAGTLTKLEVSPDGYIVGTFSSGENRKLYKVPMAVFANPNGLVAGGNGTFEITRESGDFLLKEAGVGGAGRTLGGVLEASNVDTTEELLKVQELSNAIRANARVAAIDNENFKNILSELAR